MSFRRRSMDSMRSVVSWSNFGGTGGIVYAGMRREEAWKPEEMMMAGHVGVISRFRGVAAFVDGTLVDATAIGVLTSCVLELGEILACFRVSCLGGVLAVDICRSVEQSSISVS